MLWPSSSLRGISLVAVLLGRSVVVQGDFGDYVDPTFNCPAMTTCQQVCVANATLCPFEMVCPEGEMLCADGTCAGICSGNEVSPCEAACAPIACPKVIDFNDNCDEKYGPALAAATACAEAEATEAASLYSYKEPGFIFFYTWFIFATVLIFAWSAFNQRVSPVEGSTQSLELSFNTSGDKNASQGLQTGYRVHPVGNFVYFITMTTLLGTQALLCWLVVQYYVQQELILGLNMFFDDEVQALICFEIAWAVGIVWNLSLKFPYSIRSLHYRRCVLASATHVAIAVTKPQVEDNQLAYDSTYMLGMRRCFSSFFRCVSDCMTFLFSYLNFFGCRYTSNGYFKVVPVETDPENGTKYIIFRFRRYNLDGDRFVPGMLKGFSHVKDFTKADTKSGLTKSQVKAERRVVGMNSIEMAKPNFFVTLFKEVSKPFYTYQNFMVWLFAPFWYYYMAITWGILVVSAALVVSVFQYRTECSLYELTATVGDVKVIREGRTQTIPHQELVPGDVLLVEDGIAFCDMVVVSSRSLLVDESSLTGEANYVGKAAIDADAGNDEFSEKTHKRNTIFAGTTILETDETRAIVLKTSSWTARGALIREIYSYQRHQFKFDVEVPIVLACLIGYAIFAFTITVYFVADQAVYGFFYGMYVVGTILPPLLPTVFTVSVGVSDGRLGSKRIACTNPESILVAGKVTRAFFDKTGTLTKQGLDFLSVRSATGWDKVDTEHQNQSFMSDRLASGMTVCHTLTRSKTGALVGNPVDRAMFEASQGSMEGQMATDKNGTKLAILKQFDFDHHTMTQSVIVKTPDGAVVVYVKGSGENIKVLCKADSIPSDFDLALRESAIQGIYQISMAFKPLPPDTDISSLSRSSLESDLIFLGVINFKNTMREDTPEVIRHLAQGEVKSYMVTGDSILTGIRIARESGILAEHETVLVGSLTDDQVVWKDTSNKDVALPTVEQMKQTQTKLALSGEAFSYLLSREESQMLEILDLVRVYGRCTPFDKVSVVSEFVKQGYITMMCGDGGNDCGALKTAHVGVALSDAEASMVAPFTSLDKTITSVVEVLLEGRCALASALASYKYIIIYGQIETILQMINAYLAITFTEWCWVFMDCVWTFSLAFALPLSRAADKLSPTRPTASILGLQTVSSACGVLLINFVFIVSGLAYLWQQDFFSCRMWDSTDVSNLLVIGDNYESEVLFLIGGFQYITSAAAFNFGYEFRSNWFRNYVFVILFSGFSFMMIYITLVPGDLSCVWRINCVNENVKRAVTDDPLPIQNDFNTTIMPEYFQRGILGLMLGNAAAIMVYEYFVVNGIRRYYAAKRRQGKILESEKVVGVEQSQSVDMSA